MSKHDPFEPPEVTDADISWVSRLLGLQKDAFYGRDGADQRQLVLKDTTTMDVAACPGSGKTTLLVAKLGILGRKWRYRTRGVCVLSHTNVARKEIERRLGNTTAGRRILSYPHFIGTIHGFIDEFFAVPWLRAQNYPIKLIDSEICEARRWAKLDRRLVYALENKYVSKSSIRVVDTSFNLSKKKGKFPFGSHTDTYASLKSACQEVAKEGYHCYDDMFVWAHDMLDKMPGLVEVIRDRFPLLFIDEAQDNSQDQSAILQRIFLKGDSRVVCQRFGDDNQGIFDRNGEEDATAEFPIDAIRRDLPNSHRFGQRIADLACPLAVVQPRGGLKGQGPKVRLASGSTDEKHTIFLFRPDSVCKVLDAYAELLLETFSGQELLRGTFTAVGHVHKAGDEEAEHKFPHHVGHYWPDYDSELVSSEPRPRTFVQYIFAGMERAETTGEAFPCVEKVAEGVLRLAGMGTGGGALPRHKRNHWHVLDLLERCPDVQSRYQNLVARFAVMRDVLTKKTWDDRWCGIVRKIGETIAGACLDGSEAASFLAWSEVPGSLRADAASTKRRDNLYRYPSDNPKVCIRVGSIHSVKGETHTATLVLETFWYKHNLDLLLRRLSGGHAGRPSDNAQQQYRLKTHYVAMTRPTHLLCLAMKLDSLADRSGVLDEELAVCLRERGWQIKVVD